VSGDGATVVEGAAVICVLAIRRLAWQPCRR